MFGQNFTEHNPAPSPSGHPLLSGPPTLNDIHHIDGTRYSPIHTAPYVVNHQRSVRKEARHVTMDGADPAMMEKLMAALGQQGGEGGEGGGMDIASMMAGMGGMSGMGTGGGPEQQQQQAAQRNQADAAAKNAGEVDGGAEGKKYKCVAGGTVRT